MQNAYDTSMKKPPEGGFFNCWLDWR